MRSFAVSRFQGLQQQRALARQPGWRGDFPIPARFGPTAGIAPEGRGDWIDQLERQRREDYRSGTLREGEDFIDRLERRRREDYRLGILRGALRLNPGPSPNITPVFQGTTWLQQLLGDVDPHPTGRLHVDAAQRVVDALGQPQDRLFAVGFWTSGAQVAAFARPRTNAPFFRQNDALARELWSCLAVGRAAAVPVAGAA